MIFKNLRIRTGSDSILSDQDWTLTEKFHSPLISDGYGNFAIGLDPKIFNKLHIQSISENF